MKLKLLFVIIILGMILQSCQVRNYTATNKQPIDTAIIVSIQVPKHSNYKYTTYRSINKRSNMKYNLKSAINSKTIDTLYITGKKSYKS